MVSASLIGITFAITSSLLTFRFLIKKFGLDPALITYSNFLTRGNFWLARTFLVIALLLSYVWPFGGRILLSFVGFSFAWLIFILIVFSRTPTQPTIYYFFIFISAEVLFISSDMQHLTLAACFYVVGELNLIFWWRNQKYFYDKWVAKKADTILRRYNSSFKTIPEKYRVDVLHVATTEDIARPAIVRLAEQIYFHIKKPAYISTGIMQVRDTRPISDQESIDRGAAILVNLLAKMPDKLNDSEKMKWISRHYNDSESYADLLAATLPGVYSASGK